MNKRLLATMLTLSLSCLTSCNTKIDNNEPVIIEEKTDLDTDKVDTTTKFTLNENLLKEKVKNLRIAIMKKSKS